MVLSIIIPVYNNENHISKCIESILKQNVTEYEIILVDDGSEDSTGEICDAYAKNYSNITAIHTQNSGPTAARKVGCNCAKGDYVYCVDSDDFLLEGCLERIYQFINFYHSDMIIMGYRDNQSDHYCLVNEGYYTGESIDSLFDLCFYDKRTIGMNSGAILLSLWVKIIKKSLFTEYQKIIPDEIVIGEDALLTGYILKNSKSVYITHYVGYFYWIDNSMSAMNTFNISRMYQINELLKQMKILCKEDNEKVDAFIYMVFDKQLTTLAKVSSNYLEFKSVLESSFKYKELWNLFKRMKMNNATFKQKIKIFCICKHQFRLLWTIKKCL